MIRFAIFFLSPSGAFILSFGCAKVGISFSSLQQRRNFKSLVAFSFWGKVLRKIYDEKKLPIKLKRGEMKELLELCTKSLHFSFNGRLYQQVNGVAMGSPLGPVLANTFMSELEEQLVPTMNEKMSVWLRYVDDTFTLIKEGEVENVGTSKSFYHA